MFLSQLGLEMTGNVMEEPVFMRFPSRYLYQGGFLLYELTEYLSVLFDVNYFLHVA